MSVDLLFGPMLIGAFFNAILYGVLVVQVFVYFQTFKNDEAWMRCFVLFLFIAESLNTAMDIAMLYEPLILLNGTVEATTFFPFMLAADPVLTVIISTPIQIFIAWRLSIISRGKWVSGITCLLSLISMGGGIWLTQTVTAVRRYSKKPKLHWPAIMWLLSSAIADVIITVSLSINLSRRKSGVASTDDAINKIIRLTVQTGLVTAIFAILDVVCFLALPHTTINFVWDFSLSKLYTNALLSTFNARAGWHISANGNGTHTTSVMVTHNVLFGDITSQKTFEGSSSSHFGESRVISYPEQTLLSTLGGPGSKEQKRKSDIESNMNG